MKAYRNITCALGILAVATLVASGCNTFKGAGKDIQTGGRAVENAAENVGDGK